MRKWLALIWLLGCGDDDGGDAGPQSSAAATCARGCARAATANCPNQPANCQQQCEQQIMQTPAGCIAAINAYASCINTAVFSCDSDGVAEATSCQAQLDGWLHCGSAPIDAGVPDAARPLDARVQDANTPDTATTDANVPDTSTPSDAGTGGLSCEAAPGDLECDDCLKAECCETLSACNDDCARLLACYQTCANNDVTCPVLCEATIPGGVSGVQRISQCMEVNCADSCDL